MNISPFRRILTVFLAAAAALLLAACPSPTGSSSGGSGGGGDTTPPPATTYTVSYDANGATGGSAPTDAGAYEAEETVTVLGNSGSLLKTDETFVGWNTESDGTGTNYSADNTFLMPASSVTLYARWVDSSVDTYTVEFDSDGGSAVASQSVVDGETANEPSPAPTRTGYTFTEWQNGASAYSFADPVNGALTLTAEWTVNDYEVVFDANGGSGSMANQSIEFDTSANLTTNSLTRFGHTFDGWNTESGGGGTPYADGASFMMDVEGITLYAQWTANDYDVVFNANGDLGSMANQSITFGTTESLTSNAFTSGGFNFLGWNTESDGSGTAYADTADFTMNTDGITLYAQWGTSIEVTGLDDTTYDGKDGAVLVFESGYVSDAPDALSAYNDAVAVTTPDAEAEDLTVTSGSFGPVFLWYEESEDTWVDFAGEPGTLYDVYFAVTEDGSATVTIIHGGDGSSIEALDTFTGGGAQQALSVDLSTLTETATDIPLVESTSFTVTGIDTTTYEGYVVNVVLFEEGDPLVEENLVVTATGISGDNGVVANDGSAGLLYAFTNTNTSWSGDSGTNYDAYLFMENDPDTPTAQFIVTGPANAPLLTVPGGTVAEFAISVPGDAVYTDVPE